MRKKRDDAEEFEFKPNVNELLKNVKPCLDTADSDYSEEDGDENVFDQIEVDEKPKGNTLLEGKKLEYERKPSNTDKDVKLEEEEVKMEVESESEGEEFDESKGVSESEGDEEISNSLDSLVDAKSAPLQEGFDEQEDMEKPNKRRRDPSKGKRSGAPCEICGRVFRSPSDMVKHMVTHTGARDYKCDICSESFPISSILNRFEDLLINGDDFWSFYYQAQKDP